MLGRADRQHSDLPRSPGRARGAEVVAVTLLILAAFLVTIPQTVADPFARHDDFPVLLGDSGAYFPKTLSEGRWINYLWSLRPGFFDHRLQFALLIIAWSATAALLGSAWVRPARIPWRAALAGLALAFSAPLANVSGWFATTLPGALITLGYAAIVAFAPAGARIWSLPVFVPLTLMAHGSYPLLLAAMALATPGWQGGTRQIATFVVLFALCFAGSVLAIFAINLTVHGVFGVRLADWRLAHPAHDIASALRLMAEYGAGLAQAAAISFHVPVFISGPVLLAAAALLARSDPVAAARIGAAFGLVIVFQAAQALTVGVVTPFRGMFPLWVIVVALMVALDGKLPGRLGLAAIWGLVLVIGLSAREHWAARERHFPVYQRATAAIAERVREVLPAVESQGGPATIYVLGDPREIPEGYLMFSGNAVRNRLAMLTGRPVVMCFREADRCADRLPDSVPEASFPEPGFVAVPATGVVTVRLPPPSSRFDRPGAIWRD